MTEKKLKKRKRYVQRIFTAVQILKIDLNTMLATAAHYF